MRSSHSRWRKTGLVLLALVSTVLLIQALRASVAYTLYFHAKYGAASEDPDLIRRNIALAHRLYPHNVRACAWAAESCYGAGVAAVSGADDAWMEGAELWCDRGLRLNARHRELNLLKTGLLRERSVEAAVRHWEQFVEWQFWEPANHVLLVELYAEAGELGKAQEKLALLKEHPAAYMQAARLLNRAI